MFTFFSQYDFKRPHDYSLEVASFRDRIIAQVIDGIFLGVICGLLFFFFSNGEVHSIWISPMVPQYLLEIKPGHLVGSLDFLWGGSYFAYKFSYGKIIYLAYPAPIIWLIYAAYYTLFTALLGQTPGKMIKKLVILDIDHNRQTLSRSLLRWAGYVLSLLPLGLGFWWAIRNQKHQGWHDVLASTVVYSFEKKLKN